MYKTASLTQLPISMVLYQRSLCGQEPRLKSLFWDRKLDRMQERRQDRRHNGTQDRPQD